MRHASKENNIFDTVETLNKASLDKKARQAAKKFETCLSSLTLFNLSIFDIGY